MGSCDGSALISSSGMGCSVGMISSSGIGGSDGPDLTCPRGACILRCCWIWWRIVVCWIWVAMIWSWCARIVAICWIRKSCAVLSSVCNECTKPLNSARETVTVGSNEGGGAQVAGLTGGAPWVIGAAGSVALGMCTEVCAAGVGGVVSMRISSCWAWGSYSSWGSSGGGSISGAPWGGGTAGAPWGAK